VSIGVENGIVTDHRFSFLMWVSIPSSPYFWNAFASAAVHNAVMTP